MTTHTLNVNDVLNRLMFRESLHVMELSRRTGVPQSTLQRITVGAIEKPRSSSLQPIAEYFQVSIEQLKGLEPIPWLYPATPEEMGWTQVPLLSWELVTVGKIDSNETQGMLFTDAKVGKGAFALTMDDASMEPLFPQGTLLVIDREKEPTDRSYVLAQLKPYPQAIFRQLVLDGPSRYLRPISPDLNKYTMNPMAKEDKIIGVLVQARRNY